MGLDAGNGAPAVMMLHYFGGAGRAWTAVVEQLSPRHRCIAPDLPGFGSCPPLAHFSVDAMADAVADGIAALGLDDVVLVGHSMGGKIATALAGRRPPWLRALVLVAPSPPTPEPMTDEARADALRGYGDPDAVAATLARITRRALTGPVLAAQVTDHMAVAREAWTWWLEHGSREVIVDAAARIAVPALVLGGAHDPVIPPDTIRQVTAAIPGARSVLAEDCGHLLPLEDPGFVDAELLNVLSRAA